MPGEVFVQQSELVRQFLAVQRGDVLVVVHAGEVAGDLAAAVQDVAGNQGTLGQQLGIDRTVLTYLIDDLESLGLVERRPDPADRHAIADELFRLLAKGPEPRFTTYALTDVAAAHRDLESRRSTGSLVLTV